MNTLEFTPRNTKSPLFVALALLLADAAAGDVRAQTSNRTEIAYQGFLTVDGQPANGFYDFRIRLVDNSLRQVGPQADPPGIATSNGFFQVELDFGPGAFDGSLRFLEVAAKPAGSTGGYTILTPPQKLVRVPMANFADTAGGLVGPLPPEKLPAVAARLDQPQTFTAPPLFAPASGPPFLVGQTQRVDMLNADLLDGMDSTAFWSRRTAGVTEIMGPNYRSNVLELVLGPERVLRLEPGVLAPNVIAGSSANSAAPSTSGVAIGGGYANLVQSNADYAVIPGGMSNTAGAPRTFAAGSNAKAMHQGSFVWSDFSPAPFASSNNNEFAVRASGGMRLVTGGAGLTVDGMKLGGPLPEGSVVTSNLADAAVTSAKLAPNAIMTDNLEDGAVTAAKLAAGAAAGNLVVMTSPGLEWGGIYDHAVLNLKLVPGNGISLTPSGQALMIGSTSSCNDCTNFYWSLFGNGNIDPGVHFLGTVAGELTPLEFRVNNNRTMLYTFTGPNDSPNIAGGYKGNLVSGTGGTIGGGGKLTGINKVTGLYGTVGGGFTNVIDAAASSTIAGGEANTIQHDVIAGTIGGGSGNLLYPMSYFPTIAGGMGNVIETGQAGAIGGGEANRISAGGTSGTIGGGRQNQVAASAATVSGGEGNLIDADANRATIGGGFNNKIGPSMNGAVIGGGEVNVVQGDFGTVGGGRSNSVNAAAATIAGGSGGVIQSGADYGTIAGGFLNRIAATYAAVGGGLANSNGSTYGTIAGGDANRIELGVVAAAIGGGLGNNILGSSHQSVIAGGQEGSIAPLSPRATIGGGFRNAIRNDAGDSTISGGSQNLINTNADYGTIAGGSLNTINAAVDYATIGGGRENRIETNAPYATIPGGREARGSHYGQHAYASGMFATVGDAQTSVSVLRGSFAGSSTNELFLDGVGARMIMPTDATWAYDILIIGRNSSSLSAGFHIRGVIERNGATTALDGTQLKDVLNNDPGLGCDAYVEADNTAEALVIRVTNGTGTSVGTMRWVATVRLAEVTFP